MRIPKLAFLTLCLLLGSVWAFSQVSVVDTSHNLSVSGPGQFRSLSETRICVFCHTPHSASPGVPLWNHELSAVTHYETYRSPTFDAAVLSEAAAGYVDGTSKLCLSCHDGTVALGAVRNRGRGMNPASQLMRLPPSAKGYIGTDLSGSHPVSFRVTGQLISMNNQKDSPLRALAAMKSDRHVKLDHNDKIQCTTCHNAHSDVNYTSSGIHFWNKATFSDVCSVCHIL